MRARIWSRRGRVSRTRAAIRAAACDRARFRRHGSARSTTESVRPRPGADPVRAPSGRGARYDIDASTVRTPRTRSVPRRDRPPMPSLTDDAVIDALRTVQEPELGRDLVSLDMVKDVVIDGTVAVDHDRADDAGLPAQGRDRARRPNAALGAIGVDAASTSPGAPWSAASQPRQAEQLAARASRTSSPSRRARAASARARSASTSRSRSPRPAPRSACSTRDITGPNIPLMLGLEGQPKASREQQDHAARAPRREGDLDPVLRARRASRSSGAARSSAARSSSSCATWTGASSTTSSSTCRRAPPTRS